MKITQEEYQRIVNTTDVYIDLLKLKITLTKRDMKKDPENLVHHRTLNKTKTELDNYKKIRRRALCRIYDFKYYYSGNGRQKRIERAREQRRKVWELV